MTSNEILQQAIITKFGYMDTNGNVYVAKPFSYKDGDLMISVPGLSDSVLTQSPQLGENVFSIGGGNFNLQLCCGDLSSPVTLVHVPELEQSQFSASELAKALCFDPENLLVRVSVDGSLRDDLHAVEFSFLESNSNSPVVDDVALEISSLNGKLDLIHSEVTKISTVQDDNHEQMLKAMLDAFADVKQTSNETIVQTGELIDTLANKVIDVHDTLKTVKDIVTGLTDEVSSKLGSHVTEELTHFVTQIESSVNKAFEDVNALLGQKITIAQTDLSNAQVEFNKIAVSTATTVETMLSSTGNMATTLSNLELSVQQVIQTLLSNIQQCSDYNAETEVLMLKAESEMDSFAYLLEQTYAQNAEVKENLSKLTAASESLEQQIASYQNSYVAQTKTQSNAIIIAATVLAISAITSTSVEVADRRGGKR